MQNSVWKLSALAGVVVVGFLVVLQTQFGLTRPAEELQAGPTDSRPSKPSLNDNGNLLPSSHLGLAGQTEPNPNEEPVAPLPEKQTAQSKEVVFRGAKTNAKTPKPTEDTSPPTNSPTRREFPAETANLQDSKPITPFEPTVDATPNPADDDRESGPRFGTVGNSVEDNTTPANLSSAKGSPNADEPPTKTRPAEQIPASVFGKAAADEKPPIKDDPKSNPFSGQTKSDPPPKTGNTPPFNAGGNENPFSTEKQRQPAAQDGNPFNEPAKTKEENAPAKSRSDRFGRRNRFGAASKNSAAEEKPGSESQPEQPTDFGPKFGRTKTQPDDSNGGSETPPANEIKQSPRESNPADASVNSNGRKSAATDGKSIDRFKPQPGRETSSSSNGASTVPNRLPPAPRASRLEPGENEALRGDGTVGKNAPRGPQRAQLTIEKIAPKTATLNKPFVYDIVIKNVGSSAATRVTVEDRIPKGSRLTGTAPQAVLSGKTLRWKLGTLSPGTTKKISVRIIPIAAGQIGSVATVNFVSEVAAATVISAPKVEFKLTGPKRAKLGDSVPFRFVVTNKGTTVARDVWILDILPDGLKITANKKLQDVKEIEHEIGTLKPGESRTINLTMKAVKAGTATNRGIVTVGKSFRVESKVVLEIETSRLVISRSGPKRRYVGRAAVYTNLVTNDSSRALKGAKLTEVIPAGMEFVEASGGGQYDPARRLIAWEVGSLNPKQSRTFRVKLMPKKTGAQRSIVRAYIPNGDVIQTGSETAIDGYELLALDVASLDRPMEVGEQVTLRIVARNRGTAAAAGVQIGLQLPAEFKLVSVRGRGKYTEQGRAVTFSPLASVAAGGKVAYEIVVQATQPGDARIGVTIQSKSMKRPLNREEAIRVVAASR